MDTSALQEARRDTSALREEDSEAASASPREAAESVASQKTTKQQARRSAWRKREADEVLASPTKKAMRMTWLEADEALASPTKKARRIAWLEADEASASPTKKARKARREEDEAWASPTKQTRTGASTEPEAAAVEAWSPPESTDLWTEVSKHLPGSDLIRLSCACRWLRGLLADDSIWRYCFYRDLDLLGNDSISGYAYFRDLHLPAIKPPHRYWHLLYIATFEGLLHKDDELGDRRVSGLLVHGQLLGTARLPLPKLPPKHADGSQHTIEQTGACLLTDACSGVWIAEMRVIDCPGCSIARCEGSKQVLEVHHCDLALEEPQWDRFEHEQMGQYSDDGDIRSAFCAVLNSLHMDSASAVRLINVNSWIGDRKDLKTTTCCCPYAVALNTNLQRNQGVLSVFEAVRDLRNKRKVVWLRISQVL